MQRYCRCPMKHPIKEESMTTVAEIIKNMEGKLNPAPPSGLDLTLQFNIEEESNFHAVIKAGNCNVAEGDAEDPNVTLIMDSETLNGVITGETDGMQAFMGGKLRAEGDMMLALKLGELFPV